jgi:predicted glycoside hydrolase/deacetylase ChbG (UPF0249 family)
MKRLIVNADDLGASPGITRGILEAHERGIVTSASLMVETPWSEEAATLARATPRLSVGLHVVLPEGDAARKGALERQMARFAALMRRMPTHLDSHHNVHHDPRHLPAFLALARAAALPLRGHSSVRHYSGFYGRWAGESHPEHVSVANLGRMLAREVGEGFTEFGCHPGYHDACVPSDYAAEREVELATLCDPRLRGTLVTLGITLAGFDEVGRLAPAEGVR